MLNTQACTTSFSKTPMRPLKPAKSASVFTILKNSRPLLAASSSPRESQASKQASLQGQRIFKNSTVASTTECVSAVLGLRR